MSSLDTSPQNEKFSNYALPGKQSLQRTQFVPHFLILRPKIQAV
jgi:hypothetical protein